MRLNILFNKFKKGFKRQNQSATQNNQSTDSTVDLDDENTLQSLGAVGGSIQPSPILNVQNNIEEIDMRRNRSRELANRELPPIPIQNNYRSIFNKEDTPIILSDNEEEIDPVREGQLRALIEKHIPYDFEKKESKLKKYTISNMLYNPNYYFEIPRNDKDFLDIKRYYSLYKPEEEKKLKKLQYDRDIYENFGYLYIELVETLYQKYNFSDMELFKFLND